MRLLVPSLYFNTLLHAELALFILALFQFIATMEISGLLVVQFQPRDEWSCAGMRPGAPSVMNSGQPVMQM